MVGGGSGGWLSRQDERYSGNKSRFKIASRSLAEENAFNVGALRKGPRSGADGQCAQKAGHIATLSSDANTLCKVLASPLVTCGFDQARRKIFDTYAARAQTPRPQRLDPKRLKYITTAEGGVFAAFEVFCCGCGIANIFGFYRVLFSIMNLAKGALGGGVLAGHVAYMTAGYVPALCLNFIYGIYMCFNFYLLVISAQRLCKRCQLADMTYPDVGEAAFALFPNPKVAKWSRCYRIWIDFITCVNLFGSCAAYQLIIAKSLKQLVENSKETTIEGQYGYPNLRVYVAAIIIPVICLCMITDIKYLAPFSLVANLVIALTIIVTIHYAFKLNPHFEGMAHFHGFSAIIKFTGMSVFSMSCAGVVIPVENNMKDPTKYKYVIFIGYILIIGAVFGASFFGYAAFLSECSSPITMNFPLELFPKMLKWGIILMVYVTHALNFFMPFQCVFFYIRPKFKPQNHYKAELGFRALIVFTISIFSILFPNIDSLMGFLGCFCLSNMAFICPNTIYVLVHYERPGKDKKFMVFRAICLSLFGLFIMVCGSIVNGQALVQTFIDMFHHTTKSPGAGGAEATTPKTF